jgi:hypothetical protein
MCAIFLKDDITRSLVKYKVMTRMGGFFEIYYSVPDSRVAAVASTTSTSTALSPGHDVPLLSLVCEEI